MDDGYVEHETIISRALTFNSDKKGGEYEKNY